MFWTRLLGWSKLNVKFIGPMSYSLSYIYNFHKPHKVCIILTTTSTSSLYWLGRRNVICRYLHFFGVGHLHARIPTSNSEHFFHWSTIVSSLPLFLSLQIKTWVLLRTVSKWNYSVELPKWVAHFNPVRAGRAISPGGKWTLKIMLEFGSVFYFFSFLYKFLLYYY
jgi:hypothetical protein